MFKVGDFVVRKSDYLERDYFIYAEGNPYGVVISVYEGTTQQWFKVKRYSKWIPSECYEVFTFTKYMELCQY